MIKTSIPSIICTVLLCALIAGCGPSVVKMVRIAPTTEGGNRQEKSGVIVEIQPIDDWSLSEGRFPELIVSYKKDPSNPFESPTKIPVLGDYVQFKVTVTNRTGHVLRFTGSVIKVIDEFNNMYDAWSKQDISAMWMSDPMAFSAVQPVLRTLKYLDPNTEILPDMTWSGYIAFNLRSKDAGNLFKFAIYDLVTKTDEAGNPKEKSRFEFNFKKETVEKKL